MIPSSEPPLSKTEPAWWFIITAHKLMVVNEDASISIPLIVEPAVFGLLPIRERCMGTLAGRRCYCVEVAENEPLPSKMSLYGLRYLDGRLAEPLYATAVKAVHLMEWEVTTRLSRMHA